MTSYRDRNLSWARQFLASHDPAYRFRWEIYFDELERLLADAEMFLDAGCGDNQTVREITAKGYQLGIDSSRPGSPVNFCRGDLARLPCAADSFDLIGCRFVLEHLRRPLEVFAEFHRVLRPGGYLLTQTTNRTHPLVCAAKLIPPAIKQKLTRWVYGHEGGTDFPTYHRFNRPGNFTHPQAGLQPIRVWWVEDLHLENKFAFYCSYLYHRLTGMLNRPHRRSSVTTLWQKPVGSPLPDSV